MDQIDDFVIDDWNLAALALLHGSRVIDVIASDSGRLSFVMRPRPSDALLATYSDGTVQVNLADFTRAFRRVRAIHRANSGEGTRS